MTRDAEVSTGDFLELVLAGVPAESDIGVVQGVLRQLRMAIDQFAAQEHRTEYLIRLASALLDLAQEAEAGSDRQLAFARYFANSAITTEHLAIVAGLLDETLEWPGLDIDTDTATGRRQAATARASVPTAEAKVAAWDAILHDTSLPNAMIEATIAGFMNRGQTALTDPYIDRYFEALPAVWNERTMEIAQSITMGLFPMFSVDAETVARVGTFLSGDHGPALIRLVSEGRDGLLRAGRARAKDAN
jgi:aminopeptidase N